MTDTRDKRDTNDHDRQMSKRSPAYSENLKSVACQSDMKWCPLQVKGCHRVLKLEKTAEERAPIITEYREYAAKTELMIKHLASDVKHLNQHIGGNGQTGIMDRLAKIEGKFILFWTLFALLVAAVITNSISRMFLDSAAS